MVPIKNFIFGFITNNTWFNVITLSLTILAIVLAIYFFHKSNKKKCPTYTLRTFNVIENNLQEIKDIHIQYLGKDINNFSITKLALWNNGKDSIRYEDFANKSPLSIVIDSDLQILDCELLYQKNISNDFHISLDEDKKSIKIDFDYFGYLEGIVIQIFHTGKDSSTIKVNGQLKSNEKIVRRFQNSIIPKYLNLATYLPKNNPKLLRKILGYNLICMCSAIIIYTIYRHFFMSEELLLSLVRAEQKPFFFIFTIIIYLVLMYPGILILRKRIPNGFEIFEKDFSKNE